LGAETWSGRDAVVRARIAFAVAGAQQHIPAVQNLKKVDIKESATAKKQLRLLREVLIHQN